MKYLLGGIAMAALIAAPALAQTSPAAPSDATDPSTTQAPSGAGEDRAGELNRQELQRIKQDGGAPADSGAVQGGESGSTAPDAKGGVEESNLPHFAPNTNSARKGAGPDGQPSPGTAEEHQGTSSKD
jgi:hypothetical protein